MRFINFKIICFLWLILFLFPAIQLVSSCAAKVNSQDGKALVTLLEGKAFRIIKATTRLLPLTQGDYVYQDDQVKTEQDSKLELKLPDGSFIRFDESTTFKLASVLYIKKDKERNINVRMILGKTWAKVTRLFGKKGGFAISTKTAVAGVRGTVCRVNVRKDDSVTVKVYWGEILVQKLKDKEKAQESTKQIGKITKPTRVSGPYPVPGPHSVSIEEWAYILKSMQQIKINRDGSAENPTTFTNEEDRNNWVDWNKKRDAAMEQK
ncbi:MAG: FecR domain-containing protein [Deltaproteobacteria bacterium]|nr:FecR domain-containing protein [Deltaproteobacteria bacterium]